MIYEGIIQNGLVVVNGAVSLPDGTPVRIEPIVAPTATAASRGQIDPVFRMAELAADAGPTDLSVNIDHYLYGHPRARDGE
jgi:hypothetical protein